MRKIILTFIICVCSVLLSNSQNSGCWQYTAKQIARSDCNSNGIFEWTITVNCNDENKVVLENKKYNKKKDEYYWSTIKTFHFNATTKTLKYKSTGLKIDNSYDYRLISVNESAKYKDYKNYKWELETLNVKKKCKD